MNSTELAEQLTLLYKSLDPFDKGNLQGLVDQLDFSNQWLSRVSEIQADAQAIYDNAKSFASEQFGEQTSATLLKIQLDGLCSEEKRLLVLAERLTALLVHRIESLRTLISLEKQMNYSSQGSREERG